MSLSRFVEELARTRIKLGVSAVHGIGVFALVNIPVGTRGLFAPPSPWLAVPKADVAQLPTAVQAHVELYCLQHDGVVYMPPHGFTVMDLVMYLNHSDSPNLRQLDSGDDFITLCDIPAGEELLLDYNTLEV